jgi:sulfide:quinone oxidoreductase
VAAHIVARMDGRAAPRPDRMVLRAVLRGTFPLYLRAELDDPQRTSAVSYEPLWWPPTKVASRWLAPHLAWVEHQARKGPVVIGTS